MLPMSACVVSGTCLQHHQKEPPPNPLRIKVLIHKVMLVVDTNITFWGEKGDSPKNLLSKIFVRMHNFITLRIPFLGEKLPGRNYMRKSMVICQRRAFICILVEGG
jgi:hypothetical protein